MNDDSPRRARALLALAAGAIAAIVSLSASASFDLDPFDSAELALVSVTAGLGHPPSQPAHTMLGWLVTRGPWSPLVALALLSIVPFAITVACALRPALDPHDTHGTEEARTSRFEPALVCTSLALLFAGLTPLRSVGSRVEVYALAACFAMAAALVVRQRADDRRALVAAGILWGLAGATNPVIAAQAAWATLAPLVRVRRFVAALALGAGALATTLACYGYAFAARARETETLVWSAPRSARELATIILARDFSGNVSAGPSVVLRHAATFLWDLTASGVTIVLLVGAIGLARRDHEIKSRDPWLGALAWSSVFGVAMVASNVGYDFNNPDFGGYVLAPAAFAVAGVARLISSASTRVRYAAVISLASIGVFFAIASGRSSRATRALAERALDAAPPRAVMLLESDHLLFSAMYLQYVEARRRDVLVLNPGWASSTWAWSLAKARDPGLVVDLSPGRGRERRLATALASRGAGRAVLAETPRALSLAGGGSLCPRAFLWSTHEGCGPDTRSTVETQRFLRDLARASAASNARSIHWDRRLVLFTGATFGAASHELGCAGVAARTYAAALGEEPPSWVTRGCGTSTTRVAPANLFTIDEPALRARIQWARNDLFHEP